MAHTLGKDVFAAATFKVRETLLFREREREREREKVKTFVVCFGLYESLCIFREEKLLKIFSLMCQSVNLF